MFSKFPETFMVCIFLGFSFHKQKTHWRTFEERDAHFLGLSIPWKRVILHLGIVFQIYLYSSVPPKNPQIWILVPWFLPPSFLGLETWDMFCFVQSLALCISTIRFYQKCLPKKLSKIKHFHKKIHFCIDFLQLVG